MVSLLFTSFVVVVVVVARLLSSNLTSTPGQVDRAYSILGKYTGSFCSALDGGLAQVLRISRISTPGSATIPYDDNGGGYCWLH